MRETHLDIAAVLFDMDGTLVDSTEVVETLWGQFAARYQIDLATLLAFSHGRQTRDTVSRFLPDGNDVDEVTAAFLQEELVRDDGIVEIPGAARLLNHLPADRFAVVTSAPRALAEVRLKAAGIVIPDVLVSGEDVTRGKPDPLGYETAARLLGVPVADCLVIEDAEAGIQAGVASGAHVLIVGEHRSATTESLPRIKDFTELSVTVMDEFVRVRVR